MASEIMFRTYTIPAASSRTAGVRHTYKPRYLTTLLAWAMIIIGAAVAFGSAVLSASESAMGLAAGFVSYIAGRMMLDNTLPLAGITTDSGTTGSDSFLNRVLSFIYDQSGTLQSYEMAASFYSSLPLEKLPYNDITESAGSLTA